MAGNDKKKQMKNKKKPVGQFGYFAEDLDEDLGVEEATDYLQDQLDEIEDDPVEEAVVEEQPAQEAEKKEEAPKKNFFDMDEEDEKQPTVANDKKPAVGNPPAPQRPAMSQQLSSFLEEDEEAAVETAAKKEEPTAEVPDPMADLRQRIENKPEDAPLEENDLDDDPLEERLRSERMKRNVEEAQPVLEGDEAKKANLQAIHAIAVDTNEKYYDINYVHDIDDIFEAAESLVFAAEEENSKNVAVFAEQIGIFNRMYKTKIDPTHFSKTVTEAWTLLKDLDLEKVGEGKKMLGELFKETLKQAFDVERELAYNEHRLPGYTEIIKSVNGVMRAAMFAFTDLYYNRGSAALFESTAFGCTSAEEMAALTEGKSLWDMDQKSDEAWEIQSREAKSIAEKWLQEEKPYEKMISDINAMVEAARKNGSVDGKEYTNKLAAAEWLLINNEKMMVADPADPLNPIPDWGNRYWKTLVDAREALGIDKHVSMREIIQGGYEATAKAVRSAAYNKKQIEDHIVAPEERSKFDSMEQQKEQFATRSAAIVLNQPKEPANEAEAEKNEVKWPITVPEENEAQKMKNQPKYFNIVPDRTVTVQAEGPKQTVGGKRP